MKTRIIKTKYDCECEICGKEYISKYSNSQYCSKACKQKAYREGYSERKKALNTLEMQLLEQKNKENELLNEKLRLETKLKEQEIELYAKKSQLLAEEKQKEKREQERENKRKKEDQLFLQQMAQQKMQTDLLGSVLGNLLGNGFSNNK